MAFAQGSRTGLAYVVEPSFGATPSSPSLTTIPYTTHSLDLGKERVQGNDIRSDRMPRVDRHGNRNAAGDIVFDLRDSDYDDILASAFFSSFDTNGVMTIGTTPSYLTIEDSANDITQFRQFVGMAVSTLNVSIAPNQMVTTTASFVGKDMTQAQTALDASPGNPSGGEPFDSYSGSISDGGSQIAIVTSLDFTLENSLSPTFVVGDATTPQLEYGRAQVTGTMSVYYEDATLIDKFLNETESSISITLDDPVSGGSYTFDFPRVKYNGAAVPVSDPQSRTVELPFVALYDATEQTNLKLTKA